MSKKAVTYIFFTTFLILLGCKKDSIPYSESKPEPTKWELITGNYKVYDTLGLYLYELDISHVFNELDNVDLLEFENFDGEFSMSGVQSNFSNLPMYVAIGTHNPIMDIQGNRWKISAGLFEEYNQLINDTIKLRFQKTNINYYIQDLVPYYSCDCIQVAVKQH